MIHDETASIVALARNIAGGLDPSREMTPVRTATLKLLLDTLIDLGAPPFQARRADDASRSVAGLVTSLNKAQESMQRVVEAETSVIEARFNGGS
jgi:hypothetical protein